MKTKKNNSQRKPALVHVVACLDGGILQDLRIYTDRAAAWSDFRKVRAEMERGPGLDPDCFENEALSLGGDDETRIWENVEVH